ncbi:hypothetical protein BJ322DRAFT_1087472 [Thelephora terrestris]|uniref:Uncharacterized protein n=1 Tax=Thelephora terrestris TaxID=56493 RepID=A0A9P6H6W1_9AGAM|nr:hypothetical protein BJ322DRAFT_1087472 [Thelephora terrestris]
MVDPHIENLASALLSSSAKDIQERLNEKLRSFAHGEIPHAANAVSALFGVLARYDASGSPPESSNSNTRTELRCTWATGRRQIPTRQTSMNTALIRSMHHGSLLDMEYRVRKRQTGVNQFSTIYLSSVFFHSVRSKLDALVHVSNDGVGEGELEVDEDSDYEEEPVPGLTGTEPSGSAQGSNVPCLDLLPGAFKTWKSLFLYLCFDQITFGPLRSQMTSSSTLSPGEEGASEALSCSPKSLYHLAQLLELDRLANLAFHDIVNKLTSENIVGELFSKSTARNDRLVEKQSLLLTSTLKTPKTTSVFQEYVHEVAGGATPHCYDALKLAFGNTVDAIREERRKIADKRKACEAEIACEAQIAREAQIEREARYAEITREARYAAMSRPTLKCARDTTCGEISIAKAVSGHWCSGYGAELACSACNQKWHAGKFCSGCGKAFR